MVILMLPVHEHKLVVDHTDAHFLKRLILLLLGEEGSEAATGARTRVLCRLALFVICSRLCPFASFLLALLRLRRSLRLRLQVQVLHLLGETAGTLVILRLFIFFGCSVVYLLGQTTRFHLHPIVHRGR